MGRSTVAAPVVVICTDRAIRDAFVGCLRRRDVEAIGADVASVPDGGTSVIIEAGITEDGHHGATAPQRQAASTVVLGPRRLAAGRGGAVQEVVLAWESSLEQLVAAIRTVRGPDEEPTVRSPDITPDMPSRRPERGPTAPTSGRNLPAKPAASHP